MKLSTTIRWGRRATLIMLFLVGACASHAPSGPLDQQHPPGAAPVTQLINERVIDAERREREGQVNRSVVIASHPVDIIRNRVAITSYQLRKRIFIASSRGFE